MLKVAGVFREFVWRATAGPSIFDYTGKVGRHEADAILPYLTHSAFGFWDVMEMVRDPFVLTKGIPGGSSLCSDGVWVWRNDYAYFLTNYGVCLEEEFISHCRQSKVHEFDREVWRAMANEVSRAYSDHQKLIFKPKPYDSHVRK